MPPDAGEFSGSGAGKSLRVLTPLHSFEPGGVERIAIRLHQAWNDVGIDSHLIFGRVSGKMRAEFPTLRFHTLAPEWLATARWETLWMILTLPRAIRQLRPDVIFCAGNTYAIVMVAMRLLLGRACPPILCKVSNDLYRRDLPPPARWLYHRWLKIQACYIDRFVALAPAMRPEIISLLRVDANKVDIIEDPALTSRDVSRPLSIEPPGDEPGIRYLAIGRLVPQKNFRLLLRAFARARTPNDRLIVLGDGPERAALEALADQLHVRDQLAFEGHVPDVKPYLARADRFVLSSDYEGVPAVVLEALAAGLPVVATDCCASMRGIVADTGFGIVVPVRDCDALSDAMQAARTIALDRSAVQNMLRRFTMAYAASAYRGALSCAAHQRVRCP
tara:strand:+ start:432 stop:1601 length:1170 start_codon:yes stop_codon:yes gene_type:complete